jgi:hypothetical protein
MKSLKKTVALFALLIAAVNVNAQQATVENILNLRNIKSSGTIIENDKLVGYYMFYFLEKKDSKMADYEIVVYDDNYNSLKSFKLSRAKNSTLLQSVYNGNAFLFTFYDIKTGLEFVTFNRDGKELGRKTISKDDYSKMEMQMLVAGSLFYPIGDTGFAHKVENTIVGYDNKMKQEWKYVSELEDKKQYRVTDITSISAEYIVATIYVKKNLMTKKMDLEFVLLDATNGDLITELEMGNDEVGRESVLNSYYDAASEKIIITGEYFKPGDEIVKDKSEGLFAKEYSKDGSLTVNERYGWKEDIQDFIDSQLSEDERKEAAKGFSLFFHDVVRSENGHLFLIAEQFKKQVSGGGVALKIIAGAAGGTSDAAAFEIRVGNMIVIELNEAYKLIDFKVVEKRKSTIMLQSGMGLYGSAFLGYYVNALGGFDYAFTSRDKDKDQYTVVYSDGNRKEEEDDKATDKADRMLGIIQINAGKCEASRVPLNTDSQSWWIQAAKPGHISVSEYYKKDKKLKMRLEQLTY